MCSRVLNVAAVLSFLSLAVTGCTFQVPVEALETVDRPAGKEEIPLTMGVFYSPEFLSYEHKQTIGGGHKLRFEIGQSSADHFDQVFLALFRDIKIVSRRPPLAPTGPRVDAVIEPRFESVAIHDPSLFGWAGTWDVRLTYLFTLFTIKGEPLASWTITGVGQNKKGIDWTGMGGSNIAGEAASRALRDAGEKFLDGFAQVPEVRRWLQERGSAGLPRSAKDNPALAIRGEGTWLGN
ncbi:MAG: hypothetical protein ACE5GS_12980 [Kiloniellaceae bacterium]